MNFDQFLLLVIALGVAGCQQFGTKPEVNAGNSRQDWFNARYPSDLGPGLVDVTQYPKEMKENYRLFLAVCSACHTPARALNMPYTSGFDWKRFVHRMHVKVNNLGFVLEPDQEKRIVDFLVYDSKVRKIDHKEEFALETTIMKQIYEDIAKEREKLVLEETRALPKKETPYVGVK